MEIDSVILKLIYLMLTLALLLAFWRLSRGPSLPDRVVALDLTATLVAAFSAVRAIETGFSSFLDVAIVLALTAFLATIGFARFLERRGIRHD